MRGRFLKEASVYTGLALLQSVSGFLLLPVLLNAMTEQMFGVYGIINSISVLVQLVAGFMLASAIPVKFFLLEPQQRKNLLTDTLRFTIGSSLVVTGIFCLAGDAVFYAIFKGKISFFDAGIYAFLFGAFSSITQPYQYYLRNDRSLARYAWLMIVQVVVTVVAQLVLLKVFKMGLQGALIGKLLGLASGFVFVVAFNPDALVCWRFRNWKMVRNGLAFSLFLVPTSLFSWVYTYIDRFIIQKYFLPEYLGLHGFIYMVVSLSQFFYLTLGQTLQPYLYEHLAKGKGKEKLEAIYNVFNLAVIGFGLLLIAGSAFIPLITSNVWYYHAKIYIPFFVMGVWGESVIYMFILFYNYHTRSKPLMIVSGIATILAVAFNLVLIPAWGLYGAAAASVLHKICWGILLWYWNRDFSKNYNWKHLIWSYFFPCTLIGVFYLALQAITPQWLPLIWAIPAAGIIYFLNKKQIAGLLAGKYAWQVADGNTN